MNELKPGGRVAYFGGSFDPPHLGHLATARAARTALKLDTVLFAPTGTQPLKSEGPAASFEDRVAMTRLALQGEAGMSVSLADAPRPAGEPNYSAETLTRLRAELPPGSTLYFLMGADQYAKLDSWHRPDEVRRLARIAVFMRPGYPAPGPGAQAIPMAPVDISASDIRARARRGEDLSGLVPPAVANYIRTHRLYS